MKIHEYQAKEILRKYNVPVPNGILITKKSEAAEAAKKLGTDVVVVKAQIHARWEFQPGPWRWSRAAWTRWSTGPAAPASALCFSIQFEKHGPEHAALCFSI